MAKVRLNWEVVKQRGWYRDYDIWYRSRKLPYNFVFDTVNDWFQRSQHGGETVWCGWENRGLWTEASNLLPAGPARKLEEWM